MQDGFICLMTSGLYITEDLRNLLLATAFDMIDAKDTTARIKTEFCEGAITTAFSYASFGSFGGVKFMARIEMGLRTFDVRFLADPKYREDMLHGVWVDIRMDGSPTVNTNLN